MRGNRFYVNKPEDRFLEKFQQGQKDECWIWQGHVLNRGHGILRVGKTMVVASRFSYEYFKGKIPDGMLVCHSCDVRNCVNPNHLFLGTYQDNSDDMFSKGRNRHLRGEQNPTSKLTIEQIKEIRECNLSLRKLAEKFGVTYGHVGKIRRNESWVE